MFVIFDFFIFHVTFSFRSVSFTSHLHTHIFPMSDAAWLTFFHDTKVDVSNLFYYLANSIIPESTSSRTWSYSLVARPDEVIELAFLSFYILSSLNIAFLSIKLCRLSTKNKALRFLASVLANGWAFYGDTFRDVTCALNRRKIVIPLEFEISSNTYGGAIHAGLLAASTTVYAIGCLILFKNMIETRRVTGYVQFLIALMGLLWFGAIEGVDDLQCRHLLGHLMHVILTNCCFLYVMNSACNALLRNIRLQKQRKRKTNELIAKKIDEELKEQENEREKKKTR